MSQITLTFQHPGEQAIVCKGLMECYERIAEILRADGENASPDISSYVDLQRERFYNAWRIAAEQISDEVSV